MDSKWQRYTTYVTVVAVTASSILGVVTTVLECGVVPSHVQSGKCLPTNVVEIVALATSISNSTTSWALAIIPIFIMASRSQCLSMPSKICTGLVLVLGGCASVMSVMRAASMVGSSMEADNYLVPLSVLECGTAITAASAATLRPLFRCLGRPSPEDSGHNKSPGNPKRLKQRDGRLVCATPSKSHFSFFSEASFGGPRAWLKSFYDNTGCENAAEHDKRVSRNRKGVSFWQKSIHKHHSINQVVSLPAVVASRRSLPNRSESRLYLLHNDSDFDMSSGAGRRHAGSPDLFQVYGARERHV